MGSSNLTSQGQGFSVNIILESFLVASMVAVCSGSKMTIFQVQLHEPKTTCFLTDGIPLAIFEGVETTAFHRII